MVRFGPGHPEVEELQRLSEQELNQANAQEFLVFLDRAFPNKSWERHAEPRRIVEGYLERLDEINAAWSREITEAIQNSNTQRTALASTLAPTRSLRPQARPQEGATEVVLEHREFSERDLRDAAQYVLQRAESGQITTQGDREVYLFQSYVKEAQFTGEIGVDGIAGNQTRTTIENNVRETQIFLKELGVTTITVNGTLDAATVAAIQEKFGITMEAVVIPVVPRVEVSERVRRQLAEEVIGSPLTEANIRSYQERQQIGVDGIVGNETYFEMFAGTTLEKSRETPISRDTQRNVVQILQNGNPRGINYVNLLTFIGTFRRENSEENIYRDFFRDIDGFFANPDVNPHAGDIRRDGEAALERRNTRGGTLGGDIVSALEGNMSWTDVLERNKGTALFVGLIGFIFFGGNIPGLSNIPGMGSWYGRIAWLVGGAMLGGGELLNYGIRQAQGAIQHIGEGTSPASRIRAGRELAGSPLMRLFPNEEIFNGLIEKFKSQDALGFIRITEIPNLIATLQSGENIPTYLQNIQINGQVISNEQLIAYLESIKEAAEGNDAIYINELLNDTDVAGISSLGFGALALGTLFGGPLWLAVGLGTLSGGLLYGRELINNLVNSNQVFADALTNMQELIGQIQDPSILSRLNAIANSQLSISEKIELIQGLQAGNSEYSDILGQIISKLVIADTEGIAAITQEAINRNDISIENLESIIADLDSRRIFISTHIIGNTEQTRANEVINSAIALVEEKISHVHTEEETQRLHDIRSGVSTVEGRIGTINERIGILEDQIRQLESQRATADADTLRQIETDISVKRGEIEGLEHQRSDEERALGDARIALANLEVSEKLSDVEAHISYLTEGLAHAIEIQGIIPAVNRNFSRIAQIDTGMHTLSETIGYANESAEKTLIQQKINEVREHIRTLGERYRTAYELPTPDEASIRGYDFTSETNIINLQRIIRESHPSEEANEVLAFFNIELRIHNIEDLYKSELERQITSQISTLETTEIQDLRGARAVTINLLLLLSLYSRLSFGTYDRSRLESIITNRNTEILSVPVEEISGLRDIYLNSLNTLQSITPDERNILLTGVFNQHPSLSGLREFLGVNSQGTNSTLRQELKDHLKDTVLPAIEAFTTLEL